MLKQSLKISLRRLLKFKVQTLINVTGLGIAMAVGLVIMLFVYHHYSYDRFIENGKNSYRLITRYGDGTYFAGTFACFDDLLPKCPEVTAHTTCFTTFDIHEAIIDNKKINLSNAVFVNSSFLDFFSIEMKEGEKKLIDEPNSIFVTPELADKLFRDRLAIGQSIMAKEFSGISDSLIAYTIAGIVNPLPENSHLKYELLISQKGHFAPFIESAKQRKQFTATTYAKISPYTDIKLLEDKLTHLPDPFLGNQFGPPLEAFDHHLQPIHEIHFTPETKMEIRPTIRRSSLNILMVVGIIIFAMAVINFLNIHIATNSHFKKESAMIRYLGGTGKNLVIFSYIELFILVIISFFLALSLVIFFGDSISEYLMSHWAIPVHSSSFWIGSVLFFIGSIILISLLRLTTIRTILTPSKSVLKTRKNPFMIPLVVFQFIMVIALIGFTLLINKQINYTSQKPLGYSSDNILVVQPPRQDENVKILRDELMKSPGVISVASAHHYPGYPFQDMNFTNQGSSFLFQFGFIDKFTTRTLNIDPVIYFNEKKADATNGWLINETFYNQLRKSYSEEQIANSNFPTDENTEKDNSRSEFIILGVIKDFHYASLHNPIGNFAFYVRPDDINNRFVLVRFNPMHINSVIEAIESKISELYPGQLANISFIDEQINSQYASEQTLLRLINSFSLVAFLISILGLTGLTLYFNEQRTKEIGIRKVNGARITEILILLNQKYIKWVTIAFIIATPIAWYFMQKWLENFAYKTELSWWIFLLAGIMALAVALLTVSWQSWRAATRNPVESLRYE